MADGAATATATQLEVERFGAALGGVVDGVDLSAPIGPELAAAIRAAVIEHHVVVFRGQDLDDDAHVRAAAALGTPSVHIFDKLMGGTEPTVGGTDITSDHGLLTDRWHNDVTFCPEPPAFALLYCVQPAPVGGDTMWANMELALERLSPAWQEFLAGLTAEHALPEGLMQFYASKWGGDAIEVYRRELAGTTHPVVRTHPETGRKALFAFARSQHIVGMTDAESEAVLSFVEHHVADPNFSCRWRWNAGDLAIWDERSSLHYAVRDPWEGRRAMRRVLVDGDRPV
ncbi:MAG: TauD/TfdA family dioxygenase [Acidimicrobiales bacterium]|nr:TauD/TfdA family dioxygenase [Acidimicrobiales bacterium]